MSALAIRRTVILVLSTSAVISCEQAGPLGPDGAEPPPQIVVARGQLAFAGECAQCHASGDGFDLAFFHFTDTTIIRRAIAHVDESTATDIVAYIRSLDAPVASRHMRPFQPGGALLSSDRAFAIGLFGADAIPAWLDDEALAAIDPLDVRVAVPLPEWSIEESNLDWMPELELPAAILDDRGALVRALLAGYYAAPTTDNLVRAIAALRSADRRMDNPQAPCIVQDAERADYAECFEVRRWTSSLAAQHMLREGMTQRVHQTLHDAWWDVGNAVRKAIQVGRLDFENGEMNWASWMYLGWMFDPGRHASVYTGSGLDRIGLPRHATFVALRSLVARPPRSMAVWADARSAARFAPESWAFDATRIAYRHLLRRLTAGERPERAEQLEEARARATEAFNQASRKVTAAERAALVTMRDEVLARLE